jgi:hypothetical protein
LFGDGEKTVLRLRIFPHWVRVKAENGESLSQYSSQFHLFRIECFPLKDPVRVGSCDILWGGESKDSRLSGGEILWFVVPLLECLQETESDSEHNRAKHDPKQAEYTHATEYGEEDEKLM